MLARLRGLVKLLAWNPEDPGTYVGAWATLAMGIALVAMLALQAWIGVAITSVAFVIFAGLTRLRPPDM